jgi:hypothetical protein
MLINNAIKRARQMTEETTTNIKEKCMEEIFILKKEGKKRAMIFIDNMCVLL